MEKGKNNKAAEMNIGDILQSIVKELVKVGEKFYIKRNVKRKRIKKKILKIKKAI